MKLKSTVLVFLVVSCAIIYSSGQEDEIEQEQPQAPKNPQEFAIMYKKMLVKKRKSQHEAIMKMKEIKDSKKEKEMIGLLLKKIFETLVKSLDKLADIQKGSSELRFEKDTINEVSMIIENTAFASDLALHFPDHFHKLYDKNYEWNTILESSIGLTLKTGLIDDETSKAINLMSQELNIVEKDENYVNPNKKRKKNIKDMNKDQQEEQEELNVNKKKKKREKKKRGPGLSGSEL